MKDQIFPVKGFKLNAIKAGIKYENRYDLVLMKWPKNSSVAAVYTQNQFCAAPVRIAKENHNFNPLCAIINTGYANAGTGQIGEENARMICLKLSESLEINANQVLPFSTGVTNQ